jgi:hypothetical protein
MISLLTLALLSVTPPVDVLARVRSEIDCSREGAFRAWCGATRTDTAGFKTPKDAVLLGLCLPSF